MIVKMKQITLLCLASQQNASLEALRKLGVVHLHPVREPKNASIEEARNRAHRTRGALEAIPDTRPEEDRGRTGEEAVGEILDLLAQEKNLKETLEHLESERRRIEPYGSFDPQSVEELERGGIRVKLYRLPPGEEAPPAPDNVLVTIARTDKQGTWFSMIGRNLPEIEAKEEVLPKTSLSGVERNIEAIGNDLKEIEDRLTACGEDRPAILAHLRKQEEALEFLEAEAGMGSGGAIAYLRGFCPADGLSAVEEAAANEGWGLVVDEPGSDAPVPTLIRNPGWVNLIKPVFDFIGILPGYREVDISASFLLFFSLFFGMIVGDAGYGALFLVGTLAAYRPMKKLTPFLGPMLIVMSLSTITWGVLTGIYFGMGSIPPMLDAAKVAWLTDRDNVMLFCFVIGAVHLTLAHGWRMILMLPSPLALAQLGWICTTWALFFLVTNMVLRYPAQGFMVPLLVTGAVLIAVFMTPLKKLKEEWFNHVMLPLDLISNFVDIISYVRLFAVGLATFAVGNAFNNMAVGGGVEGIAAGIAAALVLFIGHTLNIIMATMGVLVHGIRLNALEFSGHLGMEWSGTPYRPFAKESKNEV